MTTKLGAAHLTFGPGDKVLVSARANRTVRIWNYASQHSTEPLTILRNHTNAVWAVTFSPYGRTMATASADQTVQLRDFADPGKPLPLKQLENGAVVNTIAFSPDGRTSQQELEVGISGCGTQRTLRTSTLARSSSATSDT